MPKYEALDQLDFPLIQKEGDVRGAMDREFKRSK
jgi:hypothetical protein